MVWASSPAKRTICRSASCSDSSLSRLGLSSSLSKSLLAAEGGQDPEDPALVAALQSSQSRYSGSLPCSKVRWSWSLESTTEAWTPPHPMAPPTSSPHHPRRASSSSCSSVHAATQARSLIEKEGSLLARPLAKRHEQAARRSGSLLPGSANSDARSTNAERTPRNSRSCSCSSSFSLWWVASPRRRAAEARWPEQDRASDLRASWVGSRATARATAASSRSCEGVEYSARTSSSCRDRRPRSLSATERAPWCPSAATASRSAPCRAAGSRPPLCRSSHLDSTSSSVARRTSYLSDLRLDRAVARRREARSPWRSAPAPRACPSSATTSLATAASNSYSPLPPPVTPVTASMPAKDSQSKIFDL